MCVITCEKRGSATKTHNYHVTRLLPLLLCKAHPQNALNFAYCIIRSHGWVIDKWLIDWQACWGPSPSGGKNTSNKMAKQAALGFVKRTLERCHQFKDTGKSCFSDPLFKDMFLAESSKPYASSLSVEARTGVFLITFLE